MIAMGRLFWKIFFAFWLTLVFIAAGVGVAVQLHNQARLAEMTELAAGPRAALGVAAVAAALEHGGSPAVASVFKEWPGRHPLRVLLVDADGSDLLGRHVPEAALERARLQLKDEARTPGLRQVTAPDGREYILFVPAPEGAAQRRAGHRGVPGRDIFVMRLGMVLAASLLFSAGLAWYLTRPVRHLRRASQRLADGRLDARVTPLIGKRRDEIADLGRDFDHMAERLQALVRAQKRLLHDVSHELRSPLARLRVAVGLARQQPGKTAAALERIERETERLDELVGQVLTLSRLEAGVSDAPDEDVDLWELLEDVAQDAGFEAEAGGRRVKLQMAGEAVVKGRAELLRRAFENVLRNAVKYTAEGTAVEVLAQPAADGKWIVISVCDQGPGVSAADLDALFKPFFRAGREPSRGGYGLGLAIAKRAVEAHGGRIRAANRAEGGLCVEIYLSAAAVKTNYSGIPE